MTVNHKNEVKPKKMKTIGRVFIVLVLIVLAAGGVYILRKQLHAQKALDGDQSTEERAVPVVTTILETRDFERVLVVQGNLESKNLAVVSPRIPGTIEQIYLDEGDEVIEGQSRLFKTDSVKLEEAVQIQQRLIDVEESVRHQAIANLEKTEADFHKAELDYHRFERLFEKKAVTADAFEQQQSRYKQLRATVKLANANVDLATANVQKAKADLAISEKDLADTIVYAPINGKISHRFKEPGEMGRPGEPVLRIDDTFLIEISAYLPAQYYAEIIPGETKINVIVSGETLGQLPVYYKSTTINPKLRTFEVKCLLDNPSETIAPGAMAQISVILESRKGLGVPSVAIQQRGGKPVIFTVSEGKSHEVEIQTGIENDGWTEVISDKLNERSLVVTMGQDMLDDGQLVSVQKEDN